MAKPRESEGRDDTAARDIGTMWTMTRDGYTARCALLSVQNEWELRVLVDGAPLFSERCPAVKDVFGIAEEWKERMAQRGWRTVKPVFPVGLTARSAGSPLNPPGECA